jgi:hypothetical protein
MGWWGKSCLRRLSLPGLVLLVQSPDVAAMPVRLYVENVAISVWDTDRTKAGVTLQISNHGNATADNVRVTSVAVRGGAFSGPSRLPIAIGKIGPHGSALLDLIITVPRTDGTAAYLLTITGTYSISERSHPFLLHRTIVPNAAPPGPVRAKSGVATRVLPAEQPPNETPSAGGPPGAGPNATTPMLIPLGPPRQLQPSQPKKPD